MMLQKIIQSIPAKSLGYILICGGILIILSLGIVSFYRYNSNKSQNIQKFQNQIEEQKSLGPVYLMMIKELQKKDVYVLPNPKKMKLPKQETDRFQDYIRQISNKTGLVTISVLPDIKSMLGSDSSIIFYVTLKGDLTNFRKFLIELGTIPYIDQLEEITLQQFSDDMEYKLKIRMALAI